MNKVSKRILVVDDDPDIRTMLKMMLEYNGYSATITERAEEAENLLRTGQFDLALMDMLLSGINGVDICLRIKQDKSVKPIPIVMISAHPNAKTICLDAGADDFVAKPFDMQEMLSVIEGYI
jgi:DNA-binding response OmpR family regulator